MVTEKSVVAAEHVDQRFGDHELMPRMEALLQVAGCKFEDLTQVACVIGPGGFMSLRVAVALANTLADQLQIPIAGVHLSEVYAARISPSPVGEGLGVGALWLHSTKKTELFVRGFGDYAKTWPVPMHVMLEDFLDIVRRDVRIARLYTGELIPEHQAVLTDAVGALHAMPIQDMEHILPAFLQKQEFKKQILEPWYGRGW